MNRSGVIAPVALIPPAPYKSFEGNCPLQDTEAPLRLPTSCVETLTQLPINPITPFNLTPDPISYRLIGTLPRGLVFSQSAGTISGTPTTPEVTSIKVCKDEILTDHSCQTLWLSTLNETQVTGPLVVSSALCTSHSGIGTTAKPILISSESDLNTCLRNYPARAFKLMRDLDFKNFPRVDTLPEFSGVFDGNGHSIQNWDQPSIGPLFDKLIEGAVVKNLNLENFKITNGLGALANQMRGAVVHHLNLSKITIVGEEALGAVVGNIWGPTSTPSYHGFMDHITVSDSKIYSTAPNWSRSSLLIGYLYHTPFQISNIKIKGGSSLSGRNFIGPILGENATGLWASDQNGPERQGTLWIDQVSVESTVSISAHAYIGGLAGALQGGDSLTHSYSLANLESDQPSTASGGMVGIVEAWITGIPLFIVNSYRDGNQNTVGSVTSSANNGLTALSQVAIPPGNMGSGSFSGFGPRQWEALTPNDFANPEYPLFSLWPWDLWVFEAGYYPRLLGDTPMRVPGIQPPIPTDTFHFIAKDSSGKDALFSSISGVVTKIPDSNPSGLNLSGHLESDGHSVVFSADPDDNDGNGWLFIYDGQMTLLASNGAGNHYFFRVFGNDLYSLDQEGQTLTRHSLNHLCRNATTKQVGCVENFMPDGGPANENLSFQILSIQEVGENLLFTVNTSSHFGLYTLKKTDSAFNPQEVLIEGTPLQSVFQGLNLGSSEYRYPVIGNTAYFWGYLPGESNYHLFALTGDRLTKIQGDLSSSGVPGPIGTDGTNLYYVPNFLLANTIFYYSPSTQNGGGILSVGGGSFVFDAFSSNGKAIFYDQGNSLAAVFTPSGVHTEYTAQDPVYLRNIGGAFFFLGANPGDDTSYLIDSPFDGVNGFETDPRIMPGSQNAIVNGIIKPRFCEWANGILISSKNNEATSEQLYYYRLATASPVMTVSQSPLVNSGLGSFKGCIGK